jgi:threonine/homoserine/homoserine lactone efflux protein
VIPEGGTLALFAVAALALVIVPGPAVLYVVAQSVEHGRRAGVVSALGIQTGGLVHVLAAAIGLSSLLVSSALAFEVVKYAGAAYLVYLGVRRLLARAEPAEGAAPRMRSLRRVFTRGIVVNVLNPKTALFFFAFLPQFVDPDTGHAVAQMLVLGLVFLVIAMLSDGTYALLAGTAARRLRGSRAYGRAERWVSGTVFLGLGVATALSGSRRSS